MTKPVLPDDEFRWMQRVEDSVGRLQRAPARMTAFMTNAASHRFRDLNGDSNFAYRIIVVGRLVAPSASDIVITARPTGFVPSTINAEARLDSQNQQIESYSQADDSTVTTQLTFNQVSERGNNAGLFLNTLGWGGETGDVNTDALMSVHSRGRITINGTFNLKPIGFDARTLGGVLHGMMYHERLVTAIEIHMGGGTFTGAVGLEPLF